MATGASNKGTTIVRLELYASKLKNAAGAFGVSDPYAVVTVLADNPTEKPQVLGKTEVIQKSLSPRWTKSFELNYSIGRLTRFNVGVYDESSQRRNCSNNAAKPMGSGTFEVGEILGARGNIKAKKLRSGGTLFVRVTPAYRSSVVARASNGNNTNNNTLQSSAAAAFSAGTLHLTLRGVSLKNVEGFFSKSDPFLEVSTQITVAGGLSWQTIYRSQPIMNNLNPAWPTFTLSLDRLCEKDNDDDYLNQPIRVHVYDWQKNGKHQTMGFFETSVNGLLLHAADDSPDRAFELFKGRKSYGKVVVSAARIEGRTGEAVAAANNGGGGGFGSSLGAPPSSSSSSEPPTATPVPYPTSPQQQTQTQPSWKAAVMAVSASNSLYNKGNSSNNNNNNTRTYDIDDSSGFAAMVAAIPIGPLPLQAMPPPMAQQAIPPPATRAIPEPLAPAAPAQPPQRPHFVDYLTGGLELELCIAIDFTGSNGDPRRPGTLHYIHKDGQLNDYEKALTAVGSIVARYDSSQTFPVFGFGAKYDGVIQHCFQVGKASELAGMAGVLEGYRQIFQTGLTMSGPTVFAEVIDLTAARARSKQDEARRIGKQAYKILLILTDGAVSDVERTRQALQYAADAPLSIVIVGIGNADFSAMQFLDDFQQNSGLSGGRDICQFVEFRRYQHNKSALTQATLEEIPDQLVDYFYSRGIMPLPPVNLSQMSLNTEGSEPDDYDIDLSLQQNSQGDMFLANNHGAVYDDTKYDTAAMYIRPSVTQEHAPYAPGHQFQHSGTTDTAAAAAQASSYQSAPSPYRPQNHQQQHDHQQHGYGGGGSSYQQQQRYQQQQHRPPVASGVAPAAVFHVQIPPGVSPGQQLQIQNPKTQQYMIVTIPPGVPPGGKFAVRY